MNGADHSLKVTTFSTLKVGQPKFLQEIELKIFT